MKRSKKEQQDKDVKPRTRCDAAVKPVRSADGDGPAIGKFPRKDYEKELAKLHVELVKPQRWMQATGAGNKFDYEQAQPNLRDLESQLSASVANESQVRAQLAATANGDI